MYLSDRDLRWAIECGNLIVEPKPTKIDPTSIDLHLDHIDQAKVWDVDRYNKDFGIAGNKPNELRIGKFQYKEFAPNISAIPPTILIIWSLGAALRSLSSPVVFCCGRQRRPLERRRTALH